MINYEFEHFRQKFFDEWHSGVTQFAFETSGSTGARKRIELSREQLTYSAQASLAFLDPESEIKTSLLCIRPDFIGGTMVLVRALVGNHTLTYINPTNQVLEAVGETTFDLVSMVPSQVQAILQQHPKRLHQFKTILIGGAPVSADLELEIVKTDHPRVFQTFGMTETASHIALRRIGGDAGYQVLGDVEIGVSEAGTLRLKGTVTQYEWLQTTDLIELKNPRCFIWKGRADHVINTGGIKVIPEEVEQALKSQIRQPFFIAGVPDDKWGTTVALVVETDSPFSLDELNLDALSKPAHPRVVKTLSKFVYTETLKINRAETLKKALA